MKKYSKLLMLLSFPILAFTSCNKDDMDMHDSDETLVTYNAAYVVNGESNSISVINLETNKVEKTIDLSGQHNSMGGSMMNMVNMWPHHIYISPDKSKLAIAAPGMDFSSGHSMMSGTANTSGTTDSHSSHHGSNNSLTSVSGMQMQGRILILDAVTGKLLKELTLDGMTHNAIFSPDGKELWTALMMPEGKVQVFDANTYTLLNSVNVGQMPAEVTFSDDGKKAYVANGMSNSVTIIDAVTKQIIDTLKTGEEPVGAWPGMGGMMYVDNEEGQSISIIDQMTNMMSDSLHLGFMPGMAARNTMMNQMWVSDPNGSKIHYWTKTDTGFVHGGMVNVGSGAHAMAFTPDGKTCYVTNQSEGTVSVVDVVNKTEQLKITVGVKPNGIVLRYK